MPILSAEITVCTLLNITLVNSHKSTDSTVVCHHPVFCLFGPSRSISCSQPLVCRSSLTSNSNSCKSFLSLQYTYSLLSCLLFSLIRLRALTNIVDGRGRRNMLIDGDGGIQFPPVHSYPSSLILLASPSINGG